MSFTAVEDGPDVSGPIIGTFEIVFGVGILSMLLSRYPAELCRSLLCNRGHRREPGRHDPASGAPRRSRHRSRTTDAARRGAPSREASPFRASGARAAAVDP